MPTKSQNAKLTPFILYLYPVDIFTLPPTSNLFTMPDITPIPTLPLLNHYKTMDSHLLYMYFQ